MTNEANARTAADALALPLAGGTMTGPVVLAADPAAAAQPVTLRYLQAHVGGGTGTFSPDGNGNIVIPTAAGVTVTGFSVTAFGTPSGTWAAIFQVVVRQVNVGSVTCRALHPNDGTPVGSGSVTVYWTWTAEVARRERTTGDLLILIIGGTVASVVIITALAAAYVVLFKADRT